LDIGDGFLFTSLSLPSFPPLTCVIPAKAGIPLATGATVKSGTPAFAGVTVERIEFSASDLSRQGKVSQAVERGGAADSSTRRRFRAARARVGSKKMEGKFPPWLQARIC